MQIWVSFLFKCDLADRGAVGPLLHCEGFTHYFNSARDYELSETVFSNLERRPLTEPKSRLS